MCFENRLEFLNLRFGGESFSVNGFVMLPFAVLLELNFGDSYSMIGSFTPKSNLLYPIGESSGNLRGICPVIRNEKVMSSLSFNFIINY